MQGVFSSKSRPRTGKDLDTKTFLIFGRFSWAALGRKYLRTSGSKVFLHVCSDHVFCHEPGGSARGARHGCAAQEGDAAPNAPRTHPGRTQGAARTHAGYVQNARQPDGDTQDALRMHLADPPQIHAAGESGGAGRAETGERERAGTQGATGHGGMAGGEGERPTGRTRGEGEMRREGRQRGKVGERGTEEEREETRQ